MRYVIELSRAPELEVRDGQFVLIGGAEVNVGPFRSRERADARAARIRRLAETYEDPEGVTGPENALSVCVRPLEPGPTSAARALDLLYESVA